MKNFALSKMRVQSSGLFDDGIHPIRQYRVRPARALQLRLQGMRLELAGVTLDSSTDDLSSIATTCGRRPARQHRNDLSMDSGIQGSSCDLAVASSGSDLDENIDNDSLNRSLEVTVPDCPVDTTPQPQIATRLTNGKAGSDMELNHGETFNLVEEVYVIEDSKREVRPVAQEQVTDESHAFKTLNLSVAAELALENIDLHSAAPQKPCEASNGTNYDDIFQSPSPEIANMIASQAICNGHRTPRNLSPVSEESAGDNSTMTLDPLTRTYVSYSSPSLDDVTVVEALAKADLAEITAMANKAEVDVPREVTNAPCKAVQPQQCLHFVVVAIDIGTTYSGYAFCFTRDPDSNIHMMRKWEGGDPGLNNQKTPTTLLLTPTGDFHSFGYAARDYFHDLDIQEAKKWFYFDKFKMALHHNQDLNRNTELQAANGHSMPALAVFAHALHHLKGHALRELSDQTGSNVAVEDVRWVVTVPAIWKQPAKQFMREAAYQAGLCEPDRPEGLLIALEPEAASICCRKLRLNQLVPERVSEQTEVKLKRASNSTLNLPLEPTGSKLVLEDSAEGTRYMVVDCGGGTVDITVHELSECHGTLRELHKATGGPWGSMGVDYEFERLLEDIFEAEFMAQFKLKRPAAYVELLLSFEARKRSASPHRDSSLNIFPPFAFIDYYRKCKGKEVEQTVKKYGRKDITWSTQGMLRLQPNVMMELFRPMLDKIIQHIRDVLESPRVNGIKFLFLVGGFAESQILQHEVRKTFNDKVKVIIPQGVSLTILRGAVLFGLNPGLVTVRRSKQTYGVGVLKRFMHGVHPPEKLIEKDGVEWCADVLDKFVLAEQSVGIGETVVRRYTPACPSQKSIVINIYSADSDEAQFITDRGVQRCGTLSLNIPDVEDSKICDSRREIHTRMVFGGTEVTASALDIATGHTVHAEMDFLTISSDTEV
ncbi:heat shock 70 kDa protein 12A-like isoform X2 [Periplaneta americana]|uniref:heat shock 70 kDa protein 12A-like isoform X2 n=1 Tax=Periplaneta americana TaxID=6978 RepID=UPI0037E8486D